MLVDGIDVRDVRQADLRRQIALVLQETFLFNGTMRDNLRYGKPDATDEELHRRRQRGQRARIHRKIAAMAMRRRSASAA